MNNKILVNEDDIKTNFWGRNYKITIYPNLTFIVNAEHEQSALDELIDFFDESGKYEGLIERDEILDNEFVSGGRHGYYLSIDPGYWRIRENEND